MKRLIKILTLAALLSVAMFIIAACGNSFATISAQEARQMMIDNPDAIILDVRTPEEFAQGHIPGALLLPVTQIAEQAESVLPDKDTLILMYCRSGNRTQTAGQLLADMGYSKVYDFGGLNTWIGDLTVP